MSNAYIQTHYYSLEMPPLSDVCDMEANDDNATRKTLVLVVASLLLATLIYSQVAKFEVYAKPVTSMSCFRAEPTLRGATSADTCCWTTYDTATGKTIARVCQTCQYDKNGKTIDCRENPEEERTTSGLPSQLGTALPASGNHKGIVTTGPARLGTALPSHEGSFKAPPGITSAPSKGTLP